MKVHCTHLQKHAESQFCCLSHPSTFMSPFNPTRLNPTHLHSAVSVWQLHGTTCKIEQCQFLSVSLKKKQGKRQNTCNLVSHSSEKCMQIEFADGSWGPNLVVRQVAISNRPSQWMYVFQLVHARELPGRILPNGGNTSKSLVKLRSGAWSPHGALLLRKHGSISVSAQPSLQPTPSAYCLLPLLLLPLLLRLGGRVLAGIHSTKWGFGGFLRVICLVGLMIYLLVLWATTFWRLIYLLSRLYGTSISLFVR